jgi:pyruvate/2-oxoglutarate dehydrogenase complex dihydrolipoamide dehydrogenase (E3) component
MTESFDAILVGAGQAAPSLARRLAASGMKIAFVERSRFGGTCVNTGCIPTKTWIASARAAHVAQTASALGVDIAGPGRSASVQIDMRRVKARKDDIVHESSSGVEKSLRTLEGCTVFLGTAQFEGPHTLRVGDARLEAPRIFLNVGGRASIPNIAGLQTVPYLTNSSILDLDVLPEHLVILGGSYVALEFAQMFRRFGSAVTVLQRGPRLVTREDEDIAQAVTAILEGEGIAVRTNVDVREVRREDDRIIAGDVAGSHLLVAVGRIPNTGDLALDRAGITPTKEGYIPVDEHLVAAPGIWALGDCNGRGGFTHTSYNDYEIVAANLLDAEDRKVTDRIPAYNLYIDPPLGRIGMTEEEVRRSGRPALKGVRPMSRVGRAVEKGETQGFMKALVDSETGLIVGAALLGIECDEAIHCLLDVMYARKPYTLVTHAVHIHPTVSELIPTLLEDLQPL